MFETYYVGSDVDPDRLLEPSYGSKVIDGLVDPTVAYDMPILALRWSCISTMIGT